MNKSIYISIEGNIASGKSTIMNALKHICNTDPMLSDKFVFIDEKVTEWVKQFDDKGTSILDLFYSNQQRYSLTFQLQVLMDQINELENKSNNNSFILGERCLNVSKDVFAKMLFDSQKMSIGEWKLFNTIYDRLYNSEPNMIVYCCRNASECLENVNKRAREGENNIDLGYLLQLETYHDKFLEQYDGIIKKICIQQFDNEEEMNKETMKVAVQIIESII